jgi:nucleotide-binding universal stress UspA family protein
LVILAWVAWGAVVALVMYRRGHSLVPWLGLGVGFGPFSTVLALDVAAKEGQIGVRTLTSAARRDGPLRVLVGVDGSAASTAAARAAVGLLGPRIGDLVLASVLDYDAAAGTPAWERETTRVAQLLAREKARLEPLETATVLLNGHPAAALTAHAREQNFDLLVVGTRGRGASKAVLGSVASRLARQAGVPVLLAGGAVTDDTTTRTASDRPATLV